MAMVPLEAAMSCKQKGRKSRWEKKSNDNGQRWGSEEVNIVRFYNPSDFLQLQLWKLHFDVAVYARRGSTHCHIRAG